MGVMPRVVEVRIDRLTLEGFGRVDPHDVRAALESRLGELIRSDGLVAEGWHRTGMTLSFAWDEGGGAALGESLGTSLYEGLAR